MDVACTMLTDRWLQDDTYGVAAHLPNIPRFNPEGEEWLLPEMPAVLNDCEDESVAERIEPDDKVALVVFANSGPEIDMADVNSNRLQVGEIDIIIAYVTRDVPSITARRDCGIVLRAVVRSLTDFNNSRKADSSRSLNGYKIASIDRIRRMPAAGGIRDSKLWGFVVVTYLMFDPEP